MTSAAVLVPLDFVSLPGLVRSEKTYILPVLKLDIAANFCDRNSLKVLGVDILGTAVEEAERNAAVNRLGHCSYITGNVEDAVPRMVQAAKHEEVSYHSFIINCFESTDV